jgi:hypothetical protein
LSAERKHRPGHKVGHPSLLSLNNACVVDDSSGYIVKSALVRICDCAGAIDCIHSAKLNDVAQKLLVPSSLRGGAMTAKQRLKREKAMYDAGLALSENHILFRRRGSESPSRQCEQQCENAASQLRPETTSQRAPAPKSGTPDDSLLEISEAPVGLPYRAPPISVTFRKQSKNAQPQEDFESAPQHSKPNAEEALTPPSPVSIQQRLAAEHAKEELIAAGEMTGADFLAVLEVVQHNVLRSKCTGLCCIFEC